MKECFQVQRLISRKAPIFLYVRHVGVDTAMFTSENIQTFDKHDTYLKVNMASGASLTDKD